MQRLHEQRFVTLLLAAATVSLLSGCAVDEKKEVATYRNILDQNVADVTYESGQPLSLETALLLANAHNERIAIGGENYLQALIDKDRAAASFLPTVSLIPSFSFADDGDDRRNGQSGDDVGNPGDPDDDFGSSGGGRNNSTGDSNLDVPLNLRMNLFNGFRDRATLRRSASEIGRNRALMLDLQAVVLLDVAQTYYQVLRSEQSVRVLESSANLQDQRVREMHKRRKAGVVRPLDVAQSEAQASATRAGLITAQNDVQNGRTVLSFLIGRDVEDAPLADDVSLPARLPAIEQSIAGADESRQDLAAARAALESARAEVDQAVGQYYPSVNLNFNYYFERQSNPEDSVFNGLVSANLPIFTAGVIHANVRTALSRLRQAAMEESLTRRQIEQDVRLAHSNLNASGARLAELQISRDAAQEALRQAEGNYRAGRATNLERLVAQNQLLSAELDLATATYEQKLFYLNLQRVTGRIADVIAPARAKTSPATQPIARSS